MQVMTKREGRGEEGEGKEGKKILCSWRTAGTCLELKGKKGKEKKSAVEGKKASASRKKALALELEKSYPKKSYPLSLSLSLSFSLSLAKEGKVVPRASCQKWLTICSWRVRGKRGVHMWPYLNDLWHSRCTRGAKERVERLLRNTKKLHTSRRWPRGRPEYWIGGRKKGPWHESQILQLLLSLAPRVPSVELFCPCAWSSFTSS